MHSEKRHNKKREDAAERRDPKQEHMRELESYVANLVTTKSERRVNQVMERYADRSEYLNERLIRIHETREFFLNHNPKIGKTPIAELVERLAPVGEGKQPEALHALFDSLIDKLFYQHERDPIAFAPHDAEHVILVDRIADTLIEQHPALLNTMVERYGITATEARACMSLVNLYHDCGYPHLFCQSKGMLTKATHAVFSADTFRTPEIQEGIRAVISSPNAQTDRLLSDMASAIEQHGSDVREDFYDLRIITNQGTFLADTDHLARIHELFSKPNTHTKIVRNIARIEAATQTIAEDVNKKFSSLGLPVEVSTETENKRFVGRSIDGQSPKDRLLGLEYCAKEGTENPLLTVLVIADNLHAGKERRRTFEETEVFTAILAALADTTAETATRYGFLEQHAKNVAQGTKSKDDFWSDVEANFPEINPSFKTVHPEQLLREVRRLIVKEVLKNYIASGKTLDEEQRAFYERVGIEQIPANFFHTNGHLAVESITINAFTIEIKLSERSKKPHDIVAIEKVHNSMGGVTQNIVPVNYYIAWRIEQALKSITINNQHFTVVVITQNGEKISPQYQTLSVS